MNEGLIYLILLFIVIYTVTKILSSPFRYPYYEKKFDVSGKRNPNLENLIENFINEGGFWEIESHYERIQDWKDECEEKIEKSILEDLRRYQYIRCLDDNNAYRFYLFRMQTRYKQHNYQKITYKVAQTIGNGQYSYEWLHDKYDELKKIGFEATLQDYHNKEQRKLMTKQMREQIAQRDNYTCQICGKYMIDGVGLQIDHIVPIAKGGKTVPSNLQVLCSKCNGKKSAKTERKVSE